MDEQGSDSFVYLNCDQLASDCGTRCPHLCLSHLVATTDWNLYPSVVEVAEGRLRIFVLECPWESLARAVHKSVVDKGYGVSLMLLTM